MYKIVKNYEPYDQDEKKEIKKTKKSNLSRN
jgi:hypothetical protein